MSLPTGCIQPIQQATPACHSIVFAGPILGGRRTHSLTDFWAADGGWVVPQGTTSRTAVVVPALVASPTYMHSIKTKRELSAARDSFDRKWVSIDNIACRSVFMCCFGCSLE